ASSRRSDGSTNASKPSSTSVAERRPANATSCPASRIARAIGTIGFAWPSPPANENRTRTALGGVGGGRRGWFPHRVGRPLVRSKPLERRSAELPDLRHLEELHLAD